MKILYRQEEQAAGCMANLGITDCYYKLLSVDTDRNSVTKHHHHTGFELHMILEGSQLYEVDAHEYALLPHKLLLIPPGAKHRVIRSEQKTQKVSITFRLPPGILTKCLFATISPEVLHNLTFISTEAALNRSLSRLLIENRTFETIVTVLRLAGLPERPAATPSGEHSSIKLAKQYIDDNVENNPSVTDVAQYCNLSAKQLTRIFLADDGISPGAYIQLRRAKHIEKLITDTGLSLGQISDRMHFSSEYYFSAYFKKHSGMPPGEFRKMHGK